MKSNAFPHAFLTYKTQGIALKLAGKSKVGERDAFELIFEPSAGSSIRQFIDAENYLPVKTVIKANLPQGGDIDQTAIASDFRDVNDVKVPYKIEVTSPATGFTMMLSKITNNVTVDETSFMKP